MALADPPRLENPISRDASLLVAVREVHSDLREGKFTPDRYGEKLLESRLYANLFGTSVGFAGTGFRRHKADNVARITLCSRRRLFVVDVECSTTGPSIVLQYDTLRPAGRGMRTYQRDPALSLIRCARVVDVLTIMTDAPRLQAQIETNELNRAKRISRRLRKLFRAVSRPSLPGLLVQAVVCVPGVAGGGAGGPDGRREQRRIPSGTRYSVERHFRRWMARRCVRVKS
jgi:hypothetical protein